MSTDESAYQKMLNQRAERAVADLHKAWRKVLVAAIWVCDDRDAWYTMAPCAELNGRRRSIEPAEWYTLTPSARIQLMEDELEFQKSCFWAPPHFRQPSLCPPLDDGMNLRWQKHAADEAVREARAYATVRRLRQPRTAGSDVLPGMSLSGIRVSM